MVLIILGLTSVHFAEACRGRKFLGQDMWEAIVPGLWSTHSGKGWEISVTSRAKTFLAIPPNVLARAD